MRAARRGYLSGSGATCVGTTGCVRVLAEATSSVLLGEEGKRIEVLWHLMLCGAARRGRAAVEFAATAAEVEKWQTRGVKEVAFVMAATGASRRGRETARRVGWSLSALTLTHEMARVVVVEQLYRAYTILHGLPYQNNFGLVWICDFVGELEASSFLGSIAIQI